MSLLVPIERMGTRRQENVKFSHDIIDVGSEVNSCDLRWAMNDTAAKREARLVPPFFKGGLGGISVLCRVGPAPP